MVLLSIPLRPPPYISKGDIRIMFQMFHSAQRAGFCDRQAEARAAGVVQLV